jgi:hypothetical protein
MNYGWYRIPETPFDYEGALDNKPYPNQEPNGFDYRYY